MDWSKAKNILIAAFIIANVFLIYQIEKDIFYSNPLSTLNEEHIQNIIDILEEKNIFINTKIPRKILALPVLNVAYEKNNVDKIKTALEKNNINYIDNLTPERALQEAERWMQKHGFKEKDSTYWRTEITAKGYEVIFKQTYKGSFLEKSYMKCIVTSSGIISFERLWLKPLEVGEGKKEIIPATTALLKFMKNVEDYQDNIVIQDISLGYWFDPSQMGFENVESGRAVPAWRIVLQNGDVRFVDAYKE